MKIQTWLPVPVKEPRTLADVESSREKPVLVWIGQEAIYPSFVDGSMVMRKLKDGTATDCMGSPSKYELYSAAARPTKLEDVPDRRIVYAGAIIGGTKQGWKSLFFRDENVWIESVSIGWEHTDTKPDPDDWQLTDHVAELVETEIGVVE